MTQYHRLSGCAVSSLLEWSHLRPVSKEDLCEVVGNKDMGVKYSPKWVYSQYNVSKILIGPI